MIEIPDYDRATVEEIDDIIYRINLEYDVFISAIIFGKDEIEQGPMSEFYYLFFPLRGKI